MKHLVLKIILFLSIAVLLDQLLGACLEELADRVTLDSRGRNRIRAFYKHKANVDVLFLGSSHTYMGFNPYVFDKALHVNSFNMGSSGQNPVLAYHLLKETLRVGHKPKLVIMETYWRILVRNKEDYDYASYVFRNMKFSKNKLSLLGSAFEFPSMLRLISRLHNDRHLFELCAKSLAGADVGRYVGKGYVESNSTVSQDLLLNSKLDLQGVNLEPHLLHYLGKIVDLARDDGIHVIFVGSPLPPTIIRNSRGYQNVYNIIKRIADGYGIEYIDYNILGGDLPTLADEDFKDTHHLNKSGVEIFSRHLIQRLTDIYGTSLQMLKGVGDRNAA